MFSIDILDLVVLNRCIPFKELLRPLDRWINDEISIIAHVQLLSIVIDNPSTLYGYHMLARFYFKFVDSCRPSANLHIHPTFIGNRDHSFLLANTCFSLDVQFRPNVVQDTNDIYNLVLHFAVEKLMHLLNRYEIIALDLNAAVLRYLLDVSLSFENETEIILYRGVLLI